MLNNDLHLNPHLFDPTVELKSTRAGFGVGVVEAAAKDKRVVALSADLSDSVGLKAFKEKYPQRYFEMGVAEQNLVTVASGMAAGGKIPFAASYAVFSPGRNWEQIRTTICLNNRPVKLIGSHAGVTVGPDGGSHQALEDIALMRVLPRMVVISPCDAEEARKATRAAALSPDPTYIRLARNSTPVMTTEKTPFKIGTAQVVFQNAGKFGGRAISKRIMGVGATGDAHAKGTVGIIATGPSLFQALQAAKRLSSEKIMVTVLNLSTVKPLDREAILRLARDTRAIVTVEDHQVAGGMGSAVAELLAEHYPIHIEFVGIKDQFGQSGQPDELTEFYGLDEKHIYEAAKRLVLRA
jgi:transketolase